MPQPRAPGTRWVLGSALVLAFILPALPVGGTAGASAPDGAPLVQWAYGANRTFEQSATMGNGTFTVTASFGYHVLFNQTSTSATTYSVGVRRIAGETFYASFCAPSCGAPRVSSNLSVRAWEVDQVFANFSSDGQVTVNGSAVPALALDNTTATMQSNVTETLAVREQGPSGLRAAHAQLDIGAATVDHTLLSPALGLLPDSPSPGENWSSQSLATSTGAWSVFYLFTNSSLLGVSGRQSGHPSGSLSASSRLGLTGRDLGPVVLSGGVSSQAIALALNGSYHVREGFILIPGESDLFGVSHGPWELLEAGQQTAATATLDYGGGSAHIGLLASSTSVAGATTSADPTSQVTPFATGDVGTAGVIQAEPEPYAQGAHDSQCLLEGCPGGPGSPVGGNLRGDYLWILAVGGAGVLLIAGVAAQRRRGIPEAPRPSSGRYPAATLPSSSPNPPPRPRDPAGSPPDPLGHLW